MRWKIFKLLILFFLASFSSIKICYSLPLSPDECSKVAAEHKLLADGGITDDIAKGYKFASANLSKDRLSKIKRWFELEGQIQFRCSKLKSSTKEKSAFKETDKKGNSDPKSPVKSKTDAKSAPVLAPQKTS